MLTPEGGGNPKTLGNDTSSQGCGAFHTSRSVNTLFWDTDCQRFRKDPVFRSRTAKGWGHVVNPASGPRLQSGCGHQANPDLAGNTSTAFHHGADPAAPCLPQTHTPFPKRAVERTLSQAATAGLDTKHQQRSPKDGEKVRLQWRKHVNSEEVMTMMTDVLPPSALGCKLLSNLVS